MGQFGNVVFIVWRESIEALLVIGILQAWLGQQGGDARTRGRAYLWAGVASGLVAAGLLGTALILFGDRLDDDAQQIFQTVLMLLAAGLIVQMVLWMRRHGRTLKRDLESALQGAADKGNWWGVFIARRHRGGARRLRNRGLPRWNPVRRAQRRFCARGVFGRSAGWPLRSPPMGCCNWAEKSFHGGFLSRYGNPAAAARRGSAVDRRR